MSLKVISCEWYGCKEYDNLYEIGDISVCKFHKNGGIFGTGDLFEQYAIIEEDFVNILKYIPLQKENFGLYSPRLSDILIRCGVAIEIFFREWLNHYSFSSNEKISVLRKKRKLNINDFYIAFIDTLKNSNVYVRHLNENIHPFIEWEEHSVPKWWDSYNKIKHNKSENQNNANLESALNALAGLFLLQCEQIDSLCYLHKYSSTSLITNLLSRLNYIKSPLESKRYLFLYAIRHNSPAHKFR